jgi:Glyoxalase/Bleomycin resistance protein/Dioxygenase superfamily
MSRLFGEMRQIGFVVRDIDAAMRHWVTSCGVGPWYYAEIMPLTSFCYRGIEYDLKMSIAMANSGAMQIELIQQRNDVPSMYRDFLAAGHEGMQHWSSWPENYSEMVDRALAGGWKVGQQGDSERGQFIYFLNDSHPGTVVEMSHLTPTRRRIFDGIRKAAVEWDGSNPIRPMSMLMAPPSRNSKI